MLGEGGAPADPTDATAEGTDPDAAAAAVEAGAVDLSGVMARLPGCTLASSSHPAVADALAETIRTEAIVGPGVLTDDDLGGQTLTVTLVEDGAYRQVSWAVEQRDAGAVLLPLTDAAVAVSRADADRSRLLGADEDVVAGDTPGSGGMALGQDCSLVVAQALHPPSSTPAQVPDGGGMVASPTTVAPGDVIELTFPADVVRGIGFRLDQPDDAGRWVVRWWMTSDGNGGEPTTVPADTGEVGWEDVGVGGPGPDRVLVHADTAPGAYRVCTANAAEERCVPIEVVAG